MFLKFKDRIETQRIMGRKYYYMKVSIISKFDLISLHIQSYHKVFSNEFGGERAIGIL